MNLMRLHKNYLFNKINVIIIGIVIMVSIFLSFVLVKPFETNIDKWNERLISMQSYEQSYLLFVKILMVLLSSYLFGIYFSKQGDDYSLVLTCKVSKNKYLISKILTISLTIFFILFVIILCHLFIGTVFNRWYILNLNIFTHYFEIYLISMIYGILSLISIRLLKSLYAVIIPFSLYILSEVLVDYNTSSEIVKIIGMFFPTTHLSNGNIVLLYGILHLLILNFLYFLISYFVYIKYKE